MELSTYLLTLEYFRKPLEEFTERSIRILSERSFRYDSEKESFGDIVWI